MSAFFIVWGAALELEHKTFPFAEFKSADDGNGTLDGYVAVFGNVDLQNDIVETGAFKNGLADFLSSGFISWGHDPDIPIATISSAQEDAYGLRISAEYHSTPLAQEKRRIAAERLERGKTMGLSIGYLVNPGGAQRDQKGIRHLSDLKVFEGALTVIPANQQALLLDAKSRKAVLDENAYQPQAVRSHEPMTGTHSHAHSAMGSQGTDATHDHSHTHSGDANHDHAHKSATGLGLKYMDMGGYGGDSNPFAIALPGSYEATQEALEGAVNDVAAQWATGPLAAYFDSDEAMYTCACLVTTMNGSATFLLLDMVDEDSMVYVTVDYQMDADGNLTLGEPQPVAPAFVPMRQPQAMEMSSLRVLTVKRLLAPLSSKEGRVLSGGNRQTLTNCKDALQQAMSAIDDLLAASEPPQKADVGRNLYAAHLREKARRVGVAI